MLLQTSPKHTLTTFASIFQNTTSSLSLLTVSMASLPQSPSRRPPPSTLDKSTPSSPPPPEKSTPSPHRPLEQSTPLPPPPPSPTLEKSTPSRLPSPERSNLSPPRRLDNSVHLPPPPAISTPPMPASPSEKSTLDPSPPNQTFSLSTSTKSSPLASPPMSPSQTLAIVVQPDYHTNNTESNSDLNSVSTHVTIGSLLAVSDLAKAKALSAPPPVPLRLWQKEMKRIELGLRVSALVLCSISFSLMGADSVPGWDGDSFSRYEEYIYLLSINVIGCTYSLFQVIDGVHEMMKRRHFISGQMGFCFNLTVDQILAYLVLSASSAATSQNNIWVSRFGADNFTKMVDASVSVSFFVFFVLALSSVFSAHNLFGSIS